MISATLLSAASAAVYAVTLAVLLLRYRAVPERLRGYCRIILFIVGLGAVTSVLSAAGVGNVQLGDRALTLPTFLNDLLAYPLLWGLTALMADATRRQLAVVVGLPFVQVAAFQLGSVAGGLLGLVSSVVVIAGHFVLLYLFWRPIWERAQRLSDQRRLLFWKSRNLLWFLIGMLIVYAFLYLAGTFTAFGALLVGDYIAVMIRVGFAGFLFVNIDALDGGGRDDATERGVSLAGYGSPEADTAD